MSFRRATGALALAVLVAFPACKKRHNAAQETEDVHDERQEHEPNDTREACNPLEEDFSLVGSLDASDIDVICPQGVFALEVYAASGVSVALEDNRRQRVELGTTTDIEQPLTVHMPGKEWTIILRGQGDWRVQPIATETLSEEAARFCGVHLGSEASPVILGVQELPAVFPLCVDATTGAAAIQFPAFAPANTQGFDINIEGADEHTRGTLRVTSDGAEIIRSVLEPGKRLPSMAWKNHALMGADLLVSQSQGSKTLFLRIDEIHTPESLNEFLELEPNDTQEAATAIARSGSVAGTLYHPEDVDWFVVDPSAGDVQVEILTQHNTKLRVQGLAQEQKIDALRGDDGIYRICGLNAGIDGDARFVRVAYASDADATDGVYQMTVKRIDSALDPMTNLSDIRVPTSAPDGAFGFLALADETEASAVSPGFGEAELPPTAQEVRKGTLYPPDAEQGWVFQVPPITEDLHVSIELRANSSMDLKLRVLDADGITIAQADRGAAGQDERLDLELPSGYYVVAVKATGVKGCEGEYTVEVSSPNAASLQANDADRGAAAGERGESPSHTKETPSHETSSDGKDQDEKSAPGRDARQPEEIPDYPW